MCALLLRGSAGGAGRGWVGGQGWVGSRANAASSGWSANVPAVGYGTSRGSGTLARGLTAQETSADRSRPSVHGSHVRGGQHLGAAALCYRRRTLDNAGQENVQRLGCKGATAWACVVGALCGQGAGAAWCQASGPHSWPTLPGLKERPKAALDRGPQPSHSARPARIAGLQGQRMLERAWRAPMRTGEALATLPTSSSDCIMRLMRACRLALALMPLLAMAAGCRLHPGPRRRGLPSADCRSCCLPAAARPGAWRPAGSAHQRRGASRFMNVGNCAVSGIDCTPARPFGTHLQPRRLYPKAGSVIGM